MTLCLGRLASTRESVYALAGLIEFGLILAPTMRASLASLPNLCELSILSGR